MSWLSRLVAAIRRWLGLARDDRPTVGWRTIDDPLAFIVQRHREGRLATVHDLLTERRHDWPLPIGWEASESVLMDDGRVLQTFDFVRPEHDAGDGGQILEVGADGFVRAIATRDGGTPYMQYFVGQAYGGTGWIFFGADAPTGRWRELVATLAISSWSDARTPLGKAFTRYRLEMVSFPFAHDGQLERRSLRAVICEHYDRDTIAGSQALERSWFAEGYGLVRWEAWGRTPEAPVADLHERYNWVAYSDPPAPGWFMDDVRTYTNIVPCAPTAVSVMS